MVIPMSTQLPARTIGADRGLAAHAAIMYYCVGRFRFQASARSSRKRRSQDWRPTISA